MAPGNRGISASLNARGQVAVACGRRYELGSRVHTAPACTFGAEFRAWLGVLESDAYNHLLPTTWRLMFERGRREACDELDREA